MGVDSRGLWVVTRQALANFPTPSVRAIKNYTSLKERVLATNLFWPVDTSAPATPRGCGLSRKAIFEQAAASLARLDVDYVDLLQIHRFDPTCHGHRRHGLGAAQPGRRRADHRRHQAA
jgi:aryl-alcohol dehydrogenase-like predicted oxidoreductase